VDSSASGTLKEVSTFRGWSLEVMGWDLEAREF